MARGGGEYKSPEGQLGTGDPQALGARVTALRLRFLFLFFFFLIRRNNVAQ